MPHELESRPALLMGQAERVPAAVKAGPALLRATIQVTRAATGKVETYEVVGTALPAEHPKESA